METFWNLLDEELKPKGNKLLSVIELWTRSKQGSKSLNEWLTHVHNLAELCDYPAASKERIIRDVLIINCSNEKAKNKIICKGHEIKLEEVIGILQTEDSTQRTLQEMNLKTKKLHYASYDKKKAGSKGNKKKSFSSPALKSSGSTSQSTSSGRLCYRCRKPYTKEHKAVCKAKTAKCNGCGEIGHYKNCCKKAGNFPKKPQHTKKMHITGVAEQEFYDEEGNRVTVSSQHMLSMKHSKPSNLDGWMDPISSNLALTAVPPKDVQHIHPDSLKNKPLTQEMIETTYQDVFQGLGKFPGEPYKLRLKENYVPAKHQL